MKINIRKVSHIEIWTNTIKYRVQFVSATNRRMGRPATVNTRNEAIGVGRIWANQVAEQTGDIIAVIEREQT